MVGAFYDGFFDGKILTKSRESFAETRPKKARVAHNWYREHEISDSVREIERERDQFLSCAPRQQIIEYARGSLGFSPQKSGATIQWLYVDDARALPRTYTVRTQELRSRDDFHMCTAIWFVANLYEAFKLLTHVRYDDRVKHKTRKQMPHSVRAANQFLLGTRPLMFKVLAKMYADNKEIIAAAVDDSRSF